MVELYRGSRWASSAGKKRLLPALFEARRNALAGGALGSLADRTGDREAAEQLLFGAELAQPFVVGGRERLAGRDAGAGLGDLEPGRLLGLVGPLGAGRRAEARHDALLDHIGAVGKRQRILLTEGK